MEGEKEVAGVRSFENTAGQVQTVVTTGHFPIESQVAGVEGRYPTMTQQQIR